MKGEGEGGLVGRPLDWYTVLGKSWVGPWGVLWQKLPHREVSHWDARPGRINVLSQQRVQGSQRTASRAVSRLCSLH